jgi:hypothetical protein
MRDPIEELGNFDPGVPVSPLPAAEVRARGDRLRRRNTALVVGGAALAVALIVTPIAVFANRDGGGGRPEPAGLTRGVLLIPDEVPARDRLTDWREAPEEGAVLDCAPQQNSLDDDADSSVRRDFVADVAGSPPGEAPTAVIKTSVLQFSSEAAAREAYDRVQGWISGCPGGDDLAAKDVASYILGLEDGQGEGRRHDFYATDICTECDAIRFAHMGAAQFDNRLVLASYAEVGGPLEPEAMGETMRALFAGAVSKAGGDVADASWTEPAPALDFPLDTGLVSGSEFTVTGPGAGVEGVTFPDGFCGTDMWPVPTPPEGRLALKVTGPEYAQWRELVTFPTADAAVAALAGISQAVEQCPAVSGDEPANDLAFVTHPVDSGYDDVTFSYTYSEGLGGVVYQFVRVGHAILATAQYGEWAPETVATGAEELNGENTQLTPLMCEYTQAGC